MTGQENGGLLIQMTV